MSDDQKTSRTCPVCGETQPTAWFCIYRMAGVAKQGEPCSYSVEGSQRLDAMLEAAATAERQWEGDQ